MEPYRINNVAQANSSHVSGSHQMWKVLGHIFATCTDTSSPMSGNFTSPPFWGCCTSPACSSTTGCASTALAGAFLTTNPTLAEPFLSLNETWEASNTENTDPTPTPTSNNDDSGGGGGTNTGAIAGGVVGGIVALAAILFGLIWLLRRRKRRAAAAAVSSAPAEDESKPGVPELSHDDSTAVALKQLPGRIARVRNFHENLTD